MFDAFTQRLRSKRMKTASFEVNDEEFTRATQGAISRLLNQIVGADIAVLELDRRSAPPVTPPQECLRVPGHRPDGRVVGYGVSDV